MKKALICSVAALAILLACGTAVPKEPGAKKARGEGAKAKVEAKRAQKKEASEAEKQWQQKLAAMTPEQRRIAIANKALEKELSPWKQVRVLAVEEKATKTVAAIDKIIAARMEQHKKKLEAMGKSKERQPRKANKPIRDKRPKKQPETEVKP